MRSWSPDAERQRSRSQVKRSEPKAVGRAGAGGADASGPPVQLPGTRFLDLRRVVLPAERLGGPPPEGARLDLPDDVVRHLHVLRLSPGTELELTDGEGGEARAVLASLDKRAGTVEIFEARHHPRPPGPEIVLVQGVGKGDKLDQVVRQAAELGAARLVPVASERAVAHRENRIDRLRAIADDALRVSRRAYRMRVDPPAPLEAVLESLDLGASDGALGLVFLLGARRPLRSVLDEALERGPLKRVTLFVGPEGGFSPAEVSRLEGAGLADVHLGPFVLRTETAGPAVVAMTRFALGTD